VWLFFTKKTDRLQGAAEGGRTARCLGVCELVTNHTTLINRFFALAGALLLSGRLYAQVSGCTDPLAINYHAAAQQNDGSCLYAPTTLLPGQQWLLPASLAETSGLIFWEGQLWTHNDDTDQRLYAFLPQSLPALQSYPLADCVNLDWEDIAQDDDYVYIGDFGNNASGNRSDLRILRVEKSSLLAGDALVDTLFFSYELQTTLPPAPPNQTDFDCEAFIARGDSLYLFTKEWVSYGCAVYVLPRTPGSHVARFQSRHNVEGLITGATQVPGAPSVVLSGYSPLLQPFVYLLYDFEGDRFWSGNKRKIQLNLPFHQVEGITTADGHNFFLSNERLQQSVLTVPAKVSQLVLGDYLLSAGSLQLPGFAVWPNPFAEVLQLQAGQEGEGFRYRLLDLSGRPVAAGEGVSLVSLGAQGLPPGAYVLQVWQGASHRQWVVVKK